MGKKENLFAVRENSANKEGTKRSNKEKDGCDIKPLYVESLEPRFHGLAIHSSYMLKPI